MKKAQQMVLLNNRAAHPVRIVRPGQDAIIVASDTAEEVVLFVNGAGELVLNAIDADGNEIDAILAYPD
jgi:imidazole glycerol phosphate synthase subunit HisF